LANGAYHPFCERGIGGIIRIRPAEPWRTFNYRLFTICGRNSPVADLATGRRTNPI